ncbi:YhfX family PLP-dependent enzyme [Actinomadura soli]|uniref:YhfX family PLP-dependent enzyme n=1 Tax=Actinomadura soli TaxID=2508997 RepID=A0A5C4J943_9ACTN|nr:alanine racemase [Actinomadura soli]TMQ96263.1 YhfX family PLP-dependent enzyme [Actinomadura soli]
MFLTATTARNPGLVDAAVGLHRDGRIPPDTYLIDLDAVAANTAALAAVADAHDVRLWPVFKHVGRNPHVIRTVAGHLPDAAAIDLRDAHAVRRAGARLGNVGHLVQLPINAVDEVLAWRPEHVTVFGVEQARAVSAAAARLGITQPLLARVVAATDLIYPGQEGGVPLPDVEKFAAEVGDLDAVSLEGITSFPCLLYDESAGSITPTPNLQTLLTARSRLAAAGSPIRSISAPSATAAASVPLLAAHGVTHGEPGHALTGTTPLHAADLTQPEIPALVYVSEIAHILPDGRPTIVGGGFYPRGRPDEALVFPGIGEPFTLPVEPAPPENIDYYRLLGAPSPGPPLRVGDTVVLAFRTQIFVTRSAVGAVQGVASGKPRLLGLADSHGRPW